MEVINFYRYVHHAEIAKNHLKVQFCIFPFLSLKFNKFPVAKAKQKPTPAIFSSSESEIAPGENFSENHEEVKSFPEFLSG